MADTKITDLTALAGSAVSLDADVIPIVDVSAGQTKKITVEQLRFSMGIAAAAQVTVSGSNYTLQAGSFNVASITDNGTGDVTVTLTTAMSATTKMFPLALPISSGANDAKITAVITDTSNIKITIRNSTTGADLDMGFSVVVFGIL